MTVLEQLRPERNFPMPNDKLGGGTVIASVYYTDDIALVLILNPEPFFYTVTLYNLHDGSFDWIAKHENIVPAVLNYADSGGDY
jgi:hypothetical protein